MKKMKPIFGAILFASVILTSCSGGGNSKKPTENSTEYSIENTERCIIGVHWKDYPQVGTSSWDFHWEGQFEYNTKVYAFKSHTWQHLNETYVEMHGNWRVLSPGKISVSYTSTSHGTIPADEVLRLLDCHSIYSSTESFFNFNEIKRNQMEDGR